jgi:hypothetical protein
MADFKVIDKVKVMIYPFDVPKVFLVPLKFGGSNCIIKVSRPKNVFLHSLVP